MSAPSVDWRDRFGWNWISSVRWQGGCNSCWAFGTAALYEAMVRIEQCVWCRRSEGDIRNGVGKQCWDSGNPGEAVAFVQHYGVADPDCFPYTEASAIYTAREGIGALPLSPSPDRVGRTVRSPAAVSFSDVNWKKQWIDLIGPAVVMLQPPQDFSGYGSGVYIPTTTQLAKEWHCLLIVGYDDDAPEPYWIAKNSWGAGWGMSGYVLIGYAGNVLEPTTFTGVRNVNPDPWTKRRLRNGALIESGNGANHNNFELFIPVDGNLEHWYRDNTGSPVPWVRVGQVRPSDPWRVTFFNDAADHPAAVQSTFNRNYELVYRTTPPDPTGNSSGDGRLRHVYYDQFAGDWLDMSTFGPQDVLGVPGFVQGTRGTPGDFEVVVLRTNGIMEHWTKHNSLPWTTFPPGTWYRQDQYGGDIAFAGPALVSSRIGITGVLEADQGELHYVAVTQSGQMCHYALAPGAVWQQLALFGAGNLNNAPCMVEGQFGATSELDFGNVELCVAQPGQIQHWFRDNHGSQAWYQTATFGQGIARVVALLESSYGFDLEVIAQTFDGHHQHFWRDASGWNTGVTIN